MVDNAARYVLNSGGSKTSFERINKILMKNLIDVVAKAIKSSWHNKIKRSMVVCTIAILLNGVSGEALAGNMFGEAATPWGGAQTRPYFMDAESFLRHGMGSQSLDDSQFYVPVLTGAIGSKFNLRRYHPVMKKVRPHRGLDIRAPHGTPIYAPARGVVVFSGTMRGYGKVIVIDHQRGYRTLIAHNSVNYVKKGDYVTRTTMIGRVGATGTATGPHMHVEVTYNDKLIDPIQFVK